MGGADGFRTYKGAVHIPGCAVEQIFSDVDLQGEGTGYRLQNLET